VNQLARRILDELYEGAARGLRSKNGSADATDDDGRDGFDGGNGGSGDGGDGDSGDGGGDADTDTDTGASVSVSVSLGSGGGGGTARALPPELDEWVACVHVRRGDKVTKESMHARCGVCTMRDACAVAALPGHAQRGTRACLHVQV
jgi:hypothetical protein